MRIAVFDAESDTLLDEVTKIHCLCYQVIEDGVQKETISLTNYEDMVKFIKNEDNYIDYFAGHNIIDFDNELFKIILGEHINGKLIDTLGLAYYLDPKAKKVGLESYGNQLGIEKPKIEDWKKGTIEEYLFRCAEDVRINTEIFLIFFSYLIELYGDVDIVLNKVIPYLNFKMDCLKEQRESGIPIDIDKCYIFRDELQVLFTDKTKELSGVMPRENAKLLKKRPAKMTKADGTPSVIGIKWVEYLKENNLPLDTIEHREECNPGSDPQLKKWLFSLGWQPREFKISKNTGAKIPQVSLKFGAGLCPSVKELYEVEPNLEILDGYFMVRHRLGIFKSYIKNYNPKTGKVYARANKFTKTLRLAHAKPIANLPKPGVFYGQQIREVLIAPGKDYIMCGSDVSSLEDSTKQHYIYYYDPKYVEEMRVPGFDPHIDIGRIAGLISKEEEELFKRIEALSDKEKENLVLEEEESISLKIVKKTRGTAKVVNFSATYGAGGPKIAETAKISLKEGMELHKIYWKRNWAVKQIAKDCAVKIVKNQKWLYNPVSGLWLYLSAEKDRFSALNQSTGVFVFDTWLSIVREKFRNLGIKVSMQYHDEILFYCHKNVRDIVARILRESMSEVNTILNLNIKISISVDFGQNYAEVH